MVELTVSEANLFPVMVDLLEKGNPETRIAKYFVQEKMTPERVGSFLMKLGVSVDWHQRIYCRFIELSQMPKRWERDDAQALAKELRDRQVNIKNRKRKKP